MPVLKRGLVQVYTGEGKGKTTAALGLIWRMLGWGGTVYICQFLKPQSLKTGEKNLSEQFGDSLDWEAIDMDWNMRTDLDDDAHMKVMSEAVNGKLEEIVEKAQSGKYDLMVLDEINFCLAHHLAEVEIVERLISQKADHVELVLTGRDAVRPIIKHADLVSCIHAEKHPFEQGIYARQGVDF